MEIYTMNNLTQKCKFDTIYATKIQRWWRKIQRVEHQDKSQCESKSESKVEYESDSEGEYDGDSEGSYNSSEFEGESECEKEFYDESEYELDNNYTNYCKGILFVLFKLSIIIIPFYLILR